MSAINPSVKFQHCVGQVTTDAGYLNWWQKIAWAGLKRLMRFCHYRLDLPTTTQIAEDVECIHCGHRTPLPHKGFRVDLQSIATTKASANATISAIGENGFSQRLPVDTNLPLGNVRVDSPVFPYAGKDRNFKTARNIPVLCPFNGEICKPHDLLRRSAVDEVARESREMINDLRSLKAQIK